MRLAAIPMAAIPIMALTGCSEGQSAQAGSYEQAVRCYELSMLAGSIHAQVDEIASARGVTIERKHLHTKWEMQAHERGSANGLSRAQIQDNLSQAGGRAMTAFHRPFQSGPDLKALADSAEENFDEIYECSEQAKSLALPEEASI